MSIHPKHTIGSSSPEPSRQFVNREDLIEMFEAALADFDPDTHRVLTYYGVGGIGKSRFRKKLESILNDRGSSVTWATLNFETAPHRTVDNALYWMRSELRRKEGIQFFSFDLAYAVHWQKTHPQLALKEDEVPFLTEGSLITELIGVAEDLPLVQIIAKLPGLIQKASTSVQEWWRRRGQRALHEIRNMEPAEIAEWLPTFWAYDLQDHIERSGQRIVLFIDTYEALWDGRRTESRFFTVDEWVREWVAHLPEVLWVIVGREQLRWEEVSADWPDVLDQHLMDALSDADARRFLKSCGIRDGAIQDTIVETSEGVPFFLDLAADTYEKVKQAEDRDLEPSDFSGTPREVLDRFLYYLSTEERETLKVLSVARRWDRVLFRKLIEHFQTGYPATALSQLCQFSFVKETETSGTWTLHALMRESLEEHQDNTLRMQVHRFLFDYYAEQLRDLDPKGLRDAHQSALAEAFYHGKHILDAEELQEWFDEASDPFFEAAQWQFLVPLQEELIELTEETYGPEHPCTANSLDELAQLFGRLCRFEDAELLFERALSIREKALGDEHLDTAETLSNLGELYNEVGQYDDAKKLHERSLSIRETKLGNQHPDTASVLYQLGFLYSNLGKYEKAESFLKRALDIQEQVLEPEHPDIADSLHGIACTYYYRSEYEKAKPVYKSALEIRKQVKDPDHPETARSLVSLGEIHRNLGEYEKAEPLCERALEIRKKALGPNHKETAHSIKTLGKVYHDKGIYEKAESLYNRALSIREKILGKEHRDVAHSLTDLAQIHKEQEQYEEALPLLSRALSTYMEALGEDHPFVSHAHHSLADVYENLNRNDEAEQSYLKSLDIRERVLGEEHHQTAITLYNLANLYDKWGRFEKAESFYLRTLEIEEKTLGEEHHDTAITLNDLALLYSNQGRYEEAESRYLRALAIKEEVLEPEHDSMIIGLNNLAHLYRKQDRYDDAEPFYRRVLKIKEADLGPEHPDTVEARERLEAVQRKQNGAGDS